MKRLCIIALFAISSLVRGSDHFPAFRNKSFQLSVPTNSIHFYEPQLPSLIKGSNYVFNLTGQVFTNGASGHVQLASEGFSGTTDKSTPWHVLTEFVMVLQHQSPEKEMRSLYTASSKGFLDELYSNKEFIARYQQLGSTLTNVEVMLGFDFKDGTMGYAKIQWKNDRTNGNTVIPLYFVNEHQKYSLSSLDGNATNVLPLLEFLSSPASTNLIR